MTAPRRVPRDPDLYADVVDEAKTRFAVWPSAYASGWVVKTYKERGGKYAGEAQSKDTGLTRWFGESWVDLSRPTPDGGYEPCGRKSSDDPADYPKCRPLAEAMQMTPEQVADAVRRKRRAERQVEPEQGRAPVRVPTYREDEAVRHRRNPAELLLLNPAATRALTMPEVAQVIRDLSVPDAWRTRFMQGLNVEWSEHGGGVDAHSVGALVIDHLNEDPNYYRRARQNPPLTDDEYEQAIARHLADALRSPLAARIYHIAASSSEPGLSPQAMAEWAKALGDPAFASVENTPEFFVELARATRNLWGAKEERRIVTALTEGRNAVIAKSKRRSNPHAAPPEQGRAPVRVPTYREDEAMRHRRNPAELLLLNPADDVPLVDESLRVSRTSADLLYVPFSRAARDAQWDIQFDQTPEDEQPGEIINDLAANVVDQAFDDLPLVDWVEWAQALGVSAGPGYDSDWPKAQAEAQRGGSTRRDFPRLRAIASRSLARLWTWDMDQPRRNPAAPRHNPILHQRLTRTRLGDGR